MERKKRKKSSGGESGIVLIDIFFAVLVLGVAALHLVDARSNAISLSIDTWHLRIARMLACQKMEEVITNELSAEPEDISSSGTFEEQKYQGFTYEVSEEEASISSEEDIEDPDKTEKLVRIVHVKVTYEREDKTMETFSLTTILPDIEEEEETSGP